MDDQDTSRLFYRPDLHPEREYRSDARFNKPPFATYPNPPKTPDKAKNLIDDFEELKELISIAPKEIRTITPTIDKLIQRNKIFFPDGYTGNEPETKKEIIPGTHTPRKNKTVGFLDSTILETKYTFNGLPNLFPKPTNIAINIVKPRSIVNIAVDCYRKDTIDLQKYYLTRLQTALQNYFHQILMVMAETAIPNTDLLTADFDGEAVKIPTEQNLEHLRDYICRSQVVRDQKSRFFKKTHNVDQTIMHMRTWHAAETERERYYSEQYGGSASYLDSEANAILRESRSIYDKQYAQSPYDMYKYLNSSVIMVNDILDMSLKEAKAKGALLKAGVDIFEKKKIISHANDAIASAVGNNTDDALKKSIDETKNEPASSNTDFPANGNAPSLDLSNHLPAGNSPNTTKIDSQDILGSVLHGIGGGFGGALSKSNTASQNSIGGWMNGALGKSIQKVAGNIFGYDASYAQAIKSGSPLEMEAWRKKEGERIQKKRMEYITKNGCTPEERQIQLQEKYNEKCKQAYALNLIMEGKAKKMRIDGIVYDETNAKKRWKDLEKEKSKINKEYKDIGMGNWH